MNLTEIVANDAVVQIGALLAFGTVTYVLGYCHPTRRTRVERGDSGCALEEMAQALDDTHRRGCRTDEPEGSRWIEMSDTMARHLAERLRALSREHGPVAFVGRSEAATLQRRIAEKRKRLERARLEVDVDEATLAEAGEVLADLVEQHAPACKAISVIDGRSRCQLDEGHGGAHTFQSTQEAR